MLTFILYLMEIPFYGSDAVEAAYRSTTNFKLPAVDR